jgi:hypothetical protein
VGDVDAVFELEQPLAGKMRSNSISSFMSFAGKDGWTTIISGADTTSVTGVKLLNGS